MKYSLGQNLRYRLNYSRTVVHLHADLAHVAPPVEHPPFRFRQMDPGSPADVQQWIEIINDAYDDAACDAAAARSHWENHLFLKLSRIEFLTDGDLPIGTISIGPYRDNPQVGGDARIAVLRSHQGRGLGGALIRHGFDLLRRQGIRNGESIITITRERSILLHFQCGFRPQFSARYHQYRKQKRLSVVRLLVALRLHGLYRRYLRELSSRFLPPSPDVQQD